MLHYAVVFFVIALIAAVFGFGGIAAGAVESPGILFFIFIVLAIASFIINALRGEADEPPPRTRLAQPSAPPTMPASGKSGNPRLAFDDAAPAHAAVRPSSSASRSPCYRANCGPASSSPPAVWR